MRWLSCIVLLIGILVAQSAAASPPAVLSTQTGSATTPADEPAENAALNGNSAARGLSAKALSRASTAEKRTSSDPGAVVLPVDRAKTADVVRIALILTLMAIIPAILLCMTSFVRIAVVLSMIRHGLGMPETPPNQVLISLAIFLTLFSMMPTFSAINDKALQPFLSGELTIQDAIDRASGPARTFMLRQVHDQDIKAIYDAAHKPLPNSASEVGLMQLVPAFMLNELRVSFRIGFVILLPFVLIDLVVSSILLSLGMLMVPPTTLSLPIKVLMFVLIDGWSLVLQGVLGSFR